MLDSTKTILKGLPALTARLLPLTILVWAAVAHAQWTANGRSVCSVASNKRLPAIVADGTGGVIVGWRDDRGGNTDIYARLLNASGSPQWNINGVSLSAATDDQSSPSITTDGAGGAIVAWQDFRSGAQYDIYAERVNSTGVVKWTANGVAVCVQGADQYSPVVAPDGAGGVFVAWQDLRTPTSPQIFAQRLNASGVRQWTSSGIALCSASGSRGTPVIVSDGKGGAIVAWEDGRTIGNYNIYAQRINAAGAVQWVPDGVLASTLSTDDHSPSITSDGVGGAIVTWLGDHVFAQRLDSLGVRKWAGGGVPLSIAPGIQGPPRIVSDGASGALVTWEDNRGAASLTDIYAQRVDASGSVLWTQNGVAVCAADSNQTNPVVTTDGSGGAIVAWQDFRGGSDSDIYAQRVDAGGTVRWTANGVLFCNATNVQQNPAAISDGSGGAIIVWEDLRSGIYQIYANRLANNGVVSVQRIDLPDVPGLALAGVRPNPGARDFAVYFSLPDAGPASLELVDISGRRLLVREVGSLGAGNHAINLRNDVAKLPDGTYFLRLREGHQTLVSKATLIR